MTRTRVGVWLGLCVAVGTGAASCDDAERGGARFSQPPATPSGSVGAETTARARVGLILERDAQHFTPIEQAKLSQVVAGEALHEDVDPLLILALIGLESDFRPDVVSVHGATGLMQLQPATARWIAQSTGEPSVADATLMDLRTNVRLGVSYFAYLHRRFGSFALSLEAYNRGPNHPDLWLKGLEENPLGDRFWQRVLLRYREYRDAVDGPSTTSASDPIWGIGLGHAELTSFLTSDPLDAPLL